MDAQPGKIATRLYLVLLGAVALAGAGVLLMLGWARLTYTPADGPDLIPLALIFTAPVWVLGIIAAVEIGAVARGRQVRTSRALAWGALALGGGLVLASMGGQVALLGALLMQPQRVGLDWPAVYLNSAEGGVQYHYLDNANFWVPILAIVLGALVVAAVLLDMRRRAQDAPAAIAEGSAVNS
ncbi:hypothetical protein BH23CHL7_BH23CHL7_04800 [soil metagenome]